MLRALTLLSKFFLIFSLAYFLKPEDLGLYGLVTVTVGYSIFFLGLDFYVYSNRKIWKLEPEERGRLVKSHIVLSSFCYFVFLPLSLFLFYFEILPWWILFWFFALLILEHISQEMNRLLVAQSRQLEASMVMFFRMGGWCLIVMLLMFINESLRSLDVILFGWFSGCLISIGLGAFFIKKINMGGWKSPVNWSWVKAGLLISVPMLLASLSLRGVFIVDRFWFKYIGGMELLGAYVFYSGICTALLSLMEAGVFSFYYPILISAHSKGDASSYRETFYKLSVQTIIFIIVLSASAWFFVSFAVGLLSEPVYAENLYIFKWLLLANGLFVLGMVPHYGLYSKGNDRPIIVGHLILIFFFIALLLVASDFFGPLAVPLSLVLIFIFILFWKCISFYKLTPSDWR